MVEKVLTAKAVGREFVRQYYTMLNKQPKFLHRFYGTNSEMIHGDFNVQTPIVGQVKIREHIRELKFEDCYTKVACADAFLTIGNGIVVQVVGEISNNAAPLRRFAQTFVLGPQERQGVEAGTSFYIQNDIFRYQEEVYEEIVPEKAEQVIEPTQNGISHNHDLQAHGDAPEPELIQNNFSEPEPVVEVAQPEPIAEPVANGFEEHPSIEQIMNDDNEEISALKNELANELGERMKLVLRLLAAEELLQISRSVYENHEIYVNLRKRGDPQFKYQAQLVYFVQQDRNVYRRHSLPKDSEMQQVTFIDRVDLSEGQKKYFAILDITVLE